MNPHPTSHPGCDLPPAPLEGPALDAAVARAMGLELARPHSFGKPWDHDAWCKDGDPERSVFDGPTSRHAFSPSTSWADAGPIIDSARIAISCHAWGGAAYLPDGPELWNAKTLGEMPSVGPTPLIAAMRAFVASKKRE